MYSAHPFERGPAIRERSVGRLGIGATVRLVLVDGETRCRLVDLSLDGAKVIADRCMHRGEAVLLKLDGFEAFGSLAWVRKGLAGIRFDDRIPKSELLRQKALAFAHERHAAEMEAKHWCEGRH